MSLFYFGLAASVDFESMLDAAIGANADPSWVVSFREGDQHLLNLPGSELLLYREISIIDRKEGLKSPILIQGLRSLGNTTKWLSPEQIGQVSYCIFTVCSSTPYFCRKFVCNYGYSRCNAWQVLPTLVKTFQPVQLKIQPLWEQVFGLWEIVTFRVIIKILFWLQNLKSWVKG